MQLSNSEGNPVSIFIVNQKYLRESGFIQILTSKFSLVFYLLF